MCLRTGNTSLILNIHGKNVSTDYKQLDNEVCSINRTGETFIINKQLHLGVEFSRYLLYQLISDHFQLKNNRAVHYVTHVYGNRNNIINDEPLT